MLRLTQLFVILIFYYPAVQTGFTTSIDQLKQRGTGTAYYLGFIKVYDATLYSDDFSPGNEVISPRISKCLQLTYAVDVSKNDFISAANRVLTNQFSSNELAQVKKQISILHNSYVNVSEGDSYSLCYNSKTGSTSLSHNGSEQIAIDSPLFSKIYFSIWLGSKEPLSRSLRAALLADRRK